MTALPQNFTSRKLMWTDCVYYDRRLTLADKAVAYAIAQHANADTCECWPSEETIADRVDVSTRQVRRSIARLAETGWLRVRAAKGKSNVYELTRRDMAEISEMMAAAAAARRSKYQADPGHRVLTPRTPCPGTPDSESSKHVQGTRSGEHVHSVSRAVARSPHDDAFNARIRDQHGSTYDELMARYRAKEAMQ